MAGMARSYGKIGDTPLPAFKTKPCRSGPCPRNRPHLQIDEPGKPMTVENPSGHRALRRGRVSIPRHVYLVTSVTADRTPFFHDFPAGCAAARCFEDRTVLDDAMMLAWVLMPDHAHWLIQLGKKRSLSMIVNRIKSASARMTNQALKKTRPSLGPGVSRPRLAGG